MVQLFVMMLAHNLLALKRLFLLLWVVTGNFVAKEQQVGKDVRTVLHFSPQLAPITVGVFPLVKKDGMPEKAAEVEALLRKAHLASFYDEKGAIGRRYRRQDEIGTPYCVTIDFDTIDDHAVTIRDRDTMHQARVPVSELVEILKDKIEHAW